MDESVKQEKNGCSTCEKENEPCISFFAHENDMMHKDMDNERTHKMIFFVCATFIVITLIFVFAYTIRMNSFVELIKEMNAAIIQLANGKIPTTP